MKNPRARALGSTKARLDAVQALRALESGPELVAALRAALRDPSEHVVARAAGLSGERELAELEDDLVAAFGRLMRDPLEHDRGCVGKAAVVEALVRTGSERTETYLEAAGHVQREPVFGGRVDTAAGLRAAAAMGLVRSAHPRAYEILADLLADPEEAARIGAAEAAAHGAPHVVSPLLRLRALMGHPEARVAGACFGALLEVEGERGLEFVARFLDATSPELQEAAALALGESRLEGAYPLLCRWRDHASFRDADRVAFLALALLRSEAALSHLVEMVRTGKPAVARQALAALGPLLERDALRAQVDAAVSAREDRSLDGVLNEARSR